MLNVTISLDRMPETPAPRQVDDEPLGPLPALTPRSDSRSRRPGFEQWSDHAIVSESRTMTHPAHER